MFKLIFMFSAMRHFANSLRKQGYKVHYSKIDDENYQLDDSHSNSNKVVLYIIAILVLIFLFIIDFDLSIFSKK